MLISHPLASSGSYHVTTTCETRSVQLYRIQIYRGVPKIKSPAPVPWRRPFWGYFVICETGLAKIYPYNKFEVSSFTCFKIMERVLKFGLTWPDHAPLAEFCNPWDGTWQHLSLYQIWNFQLHQFQRHGGGPKAMSGCTRVCAQTNAWISVIFYPPSTNFCVNIVDWLMLMF